jgi:GDP/UDP-N,N'-diacetylbacillosamine 2-epimerase (hydrolysing)
MAIVDGIIGNSSSGILEAPTLRVGTINIGDRQLGRIQAESIINSVLNREQISLALDKLYSKAFQSTLRTCRSPYGEGGASRVVVKVLSESSFGGIIQKTFNDLPRG